MGKSLEPSSSISLHNRKIDWKDTSSGPPLQATYRSTPRLVMSPVLRDSRPLAPSADTTICKLRTPRRPAATRLRDAEPGSDRRLLPAAAVFAAPPPGPGQLRSAQRSAAEAPPGSANSRRSRASHPLNAPRQAPGRPRTLAAAWSQRAPPAPPRLPSIPEAPHGAFHS